MACMTGAVKASTAAAASVARRCFSFMFPLLSLSDVALLGGLLIPRVDKAVDDDGDEQDRRLDEVLVDDWECR